MKRFLKYMAALFLLCMLLGCAQAESSEAFWTQDADLYYHQAEHCTGMTGLVPISQEAAERFGKYPCPVCIADPTVYSGVEAVARGGTVILRMPDAFMKSQPDIGSVFGFNTPDTYTGEEAQRQIAQDLHGEDYNAFLADAVDGAAEATVYEPSVYSSDFQTLNMSARHIGGAWLCVLRPDVKFKDTLTLNLRFFSGPMKLSEGTLSIDTCKEWDDFDVKLELLPLGSDTPAFSADYGDVHIEIYREMDANICVVREKNADQDLLEEVKLTLDGRDSDIWMNGYMDGKYGIYCCTLTDAEAKALQGGAQAALWRKSYFQDADYEDTPFAIVTKGTGGLGVVDREGKFVLGPGYENITRYQNIFFCESKEKKSRTIQVYDADSRQELASVKDADTINPCPANSAVFAVSTAKKWLIYSIKDGKKLASIPFDEKNADAPGPSTSFGIVANYPCYEIGQPERLVFVKRNPEKDGADTGFHCWLADNSGKRVSGDYAWIEALIWNDGRGVYCVQDYETSEVTEWSNNDKKYLEGYDGRAGLGAHWRCGLIDQDGNVLAETKYTYIQVVSETSILLLDENERMKIVDLSLPG